jgi:hypothetical protein
VALALVRTRDKQVVWTREWDVRDKVQQLEPVYVVRKLSELLEHVNNQAIADIDSVLATQPPAVPVDVQKPFSGTLPPPR